MLSESGLRDLPRDADDEKILQMVTEHLRSDWTGSGLGGQLLAGMLIGRNYDLPLPPDLSYIPPWLARDYAAFLLTIPNLFCLPGESAAYVQYLFRVVKLFHGVLDGFRSDDQTRMFTGVFGLSANFIQAYFNEENLKGMYEQSFDLFAAYRRFNGHPGLFPLPPRLSMEGKIRIGYFGGGFGDRTETFFNLAQFDFLDRDRFDLTLYTDTRARGSPGLALEQHCISRADRFVVLPEKDLSAQVKRIRDDDLDVIIFGSNMTAVLNSTAHLGLFRLAPLQVVVETSPVTTGSPYADVFLSAQRHNSRSDAQDHYSELLYRMPGALNMYAYQYDTPPEAADYSRQSLGIADSQVVFFSGANYFKILPELSRDWARVLASTPDSVLVLMPFNPNWSSRYQSYAFSTRIVSELREYGICADRLRIVLPVKSRKEVQNIAALADVYLDPYPFSGACSLVDAFEAGVPPVALAGGTARSCHAAAMLRMMGLEELIVRTRDDYVGLACELAKNSERRKALSGRLKDIVSTGRAPYLDTRAMSVKFGHAIEDIVRRQRDRFKTLLDLDPEQFSAKIQAVADIVVPKNRDLAALTDIGIVDALVAPFFRRLARSANERGYRLIDVGACYGRLAIPFLAMGWQADLFEPDPAARAVLERNVGRFALAPQIVPMAVSLADGTLSFHKNKTPGLSGFDPSPFGQTDKVIQVPVTRLDVYCRTNAITSVDFLKIDAEGHDFDVLSSFDFSSIQPRLVMVEYGTQFQRHTPEMIRSSIAAMREYGYGAVVFSYTDDGRFSEGQWEYRLIQLLMDRAPGVCPEGDSFGNILFYRIGDRDFLLALFALLDSCLPRTQCLDPILT